MNSPHMKSHPDPLWSCSTRVSPKNNLLLGGSQDGPVWNASRWREVCRSSRRAAPEKIQGGVCGLPNGCSYDLGPLPANSVPPSQHKKAIHDRSHSASSGSEYLPSATASIVETTSDSEASRSQPL